MLLVFSIEWYNTLKPKVCVVYLNLGLGFLHVIICGFTSHLIHLIIVQYNLPMQLYMFNKLRI